MKNKCNNITTSRWLRYFLIIVLTYFSQISSFYYIHHIHQDGELDFDASTYPFEADGEHTSEHHHGNNPPTPYHQHTYNKHIDWNTVRIQNPRIKTSDDEYPVTPKTFVLSNDNILSNIDNVKLLFIVESYAPSLVIRGPPSFSISLLI